MNHTGGVDPKHGSRTAAPAGEAPPLRGSAGAAAGARLGESLSDKVSAILAAARQTLANFFELVSLELHRAGVALIWIIAGAIFALLLSATAWLGLMAAGALWLIAVGAPPAAAVAGVAFANLLAACGILAWCKNQTGELSMPATRRQLRMTATEARLS